MRRSESGLGQLPGHGGKAIKIPKILVFTFVTKNAETQTECPYKPEPEDNCTSTQTAQFRNCEAQIQLLVETNNLQR